MTLRDFLATAATLSIEERQAVYLQIEERGFDPDDEPLTIEVGSPASSWVVEPKAEEMTGNLSRDSKSRA